MYFLLKSSDTYQFAHLISTFYSAHVGKQIMYLHSTLSCLQKRFQQRKRDARLVTFHSRGWCCVVIPLRALSRYRKGVDRGVRAIANSQGIFKAPHNFKISHRWSPLLNKNIQQWKRSITPTKLRRNTQLPKPHVWSNNKLLQRC